MIRSDNPLRDEWRHERAESAWMRRLPSCYACGEKIQDEICYQDDSWRAYCCGCVHRKEMTDVYPVSVTELILEAAI